MQKEKIKRERNSELGDKRLDSRLAELVEDLTTKPNATIPEACETAAKTKAAYRFFDSENVRVEDIQKWNYAETEETIKGHNIILIAQDTSNIDYTKHVSTRGLGYLDKGGKGIKMHSAIAISEEGLPLGILDQKYWIRKEEDRGKKKDRHKKSTEEKESQRWLDTKSNVERKVDKTKTIVVMSDRESDIYDYLAQERESRTEILLRASHNREVCGEPKLLFNNILKREIVGYKEIEVTRATDLKKRQAKISIRNGEVEIEPPKSRKKENLKSIKLYAVLAKEENPPKEYDEVCWLLLTTIEVKTLEESERMLIWYSYRWIIERYHYVLKSGCQVEKLQLEEEARLERAIAVYCIVAMRILHITYFVRIEPDKSCEEIFERHEWEALYCFQNKITTPPETAPTILESVMLLAKIGGFMGRKSDGFPGVKVIWRGLRNLYYISQTYLLLKKDVGNG
jgi:hypothetical protein